MIEIREMTDRRAEKLEELTEVWEASVRATHRFLTEEEIVRIRGYVPQAMAAVEHLVTAEEQGRAVGFSARRGRGWRGSSWRPRCGEGAWDGGWPSGLFGTMASGR